MNVEVLASAFRITPACAGKSLIFCQIRPEKEDHPRVCGEKFPFLLENTEQTGSPPRVRGKGAAQVGVAARHRITPACAGKSLFVSSYAIPK